MVLGCGAKLIRSCIQQRGCEGTMNRVSHNNAIDLLQRRYACSKLQRTVAGAAARPLLGLTAHSF